MSTLAPIPQPRATHLQPLRAAPRAARRLLPPRLLLVALPHELPAALGAQHDLHERALRRAVLDVRERQLERRQRRRRVGRVDVPRAVQRAARVAAGALARAGDDLVLRAPTQRELRAGCVSVGAGGGGEGARCRTCSASGRRRSIRGRGCCSTSSRACPPRIAGSRRGHRRVGICMSHGELHEAHIQAVRALVFGFEDVEFCGTRQRGAC